MALTTQQLTTLKADILANTDPVVVQAVADGNAGVIAEWYNQQASPNFTVWRTSLSRAEVRAATVWTELIGRSDGERSVYSVILQDETIDPSDSNIRQAFADIFSGPNGATSRAQLVAIAKRLATYAEKLFATGTGSDADPATMVFEGSLSFRDVADALNS